MDNIYIPGHSGKYFVPTVNFNATTGICRLSGESLLEATVEFYDPLIRWLKKYTEDEEQRPLTFEFKLTYYNTSSSKRLYEILKVLKDYQKAGGKVVANWYLEDEDDELIGEVEDYQKASGMKVNIIIEDLTDDSEPLSENSEQ